MIDILMITALLFANAFFVATEFALVKARGVRMETLAANGVRSAIMAMTIQKSMDNYLAACQLGITMASLGLGWVGEPAVEALMAPIFSQLPLSEESIHTISFLFGFMLFSSLHIVVGEQVPKTFAIRNPEPVSMWFAYPLHAFYLLMLPLNVMLKWATNGILGLFNVPEATHEEVYSNDELKSLVDVSRDHGELLGDKAEMLSNMFAFDRGIARNVMVPVTKVDYLDLQDPVESTIARIVETRHSRFPVVNGEVNHVVGVILVKDLINDMLAGKLPQELNLADYCREAPFVPELMSASELFESMRNNRTHMVIVTDEYGAVAGMITMEDLLEEIVGEIADELDDEESEFPIEQSTEGVWIAHGLVSIAQLSKKTSFSPAETTEANTISGLFMQRLGRLPVAGDRLVEGDFTLVVEEVSGRYVERASLICNPTDSEKDPA